METLAWNGFFAGIEGEFTHHLAAQRSDGVINFPTLPMIKDPDSDALNELYAGWQQTGDDGLRAAQANVGRQRILYDDERWVGPSNFRQNDQTFDAATLETRLSPELSIRYAYIDGVEKTLGNNAGGHWDSDSHLMGLQTTVVPFGLTTVYAYLLDLAGAATTVGHLWRALRRTTEKRRAHLRT